MKDERLCICWSVGGEQGEGKAFLEPGVTVSPAGTRHAQGWPGGALCGQNLKAGSWAFLFRA